MSRLFAACWFVWCGALLGSAHAVAADVLRVGVYYFPGWKPGQKGSAYEVPWDLIKPFPEREPLLGWYEEDAPGVMTQQLAWMKGHGIDYVVFDWLWGAENRPYLAHGVNAYLLAENRHGVDFAILWANHTDYVFSREQFEALFRFWAQRYFFRPDYLKVDGKPVIFLFSAQVLVRNAARIGLTSKALMEMADAAAKAVGLPGVAVVGGIGGNAEPGFDYSANSGFAGFSAYNFHGPATRSFAPGRHVSHSYSELDLAYRDHWTWMLAHASGLYVVPMSSGWDKRPWGGSKDPLHDNSRSGLSEFRLHLHAARKTMTENMMRTRGLGVICCWNEFGEGSFIEPTRVGGFSYLEQVRAVFGGE